MSQNDEPGESKSEVGETVVSREGAQVQVIRMDLSKETHDSLSVVQGEIPSAPKPSSQTSAAE